MDFVVPPENEPDFAYLVVVGDDHSGRVFLVLRIDCSRTLMGQDFNPIYRVVLGTRMTQGLDKFLFVIPLKHRSGLFLCAEKHLALVMDIKNPRFELQLSYLGDSDIEAVDDPGCYGSDPLYTAWTRPLRRKEWWHESHKDVAYLCREDGQIKLLSLTAEPGRRSRVEVMFLYHIRSRVDQAFTAVDIPRSVVSKVCDDSFITGGDQSNGVLVTIEPNQDPKLRSIIPNLNPVIDYAVAPNNLNDPCQNNRIFATTHRGRRHGAISEVRHGYEMRVLEDVSTNDYDVVSICYLPFEDSGYLIISGPTGSSQLYHYDGEDSISNSSGDESRYPSWLRASGNEDNFLTEVLQESEDIKAIAIISDNSYIVVTNNYIQRLSSDLRERQDLLRDDLQGSKIVKACIDSQSSRVLYAVATSAMYSVNVLEICASQQKPLISLSSSSEPSCICSYTGDNISLAVVGTRDGCLEFYHQHRSTLERLCSYNLQEEDGVCENILLLVRKQEPQRSNAISLLCGLRSGELRLLDLDFEGQGNSSSQLAAKSLILTYQIYQYPNEIQYLLGQLLFVLCSRVRMKQWPLGQVQQ